MAISVKVMKRPEPGSTSYLRAALSGMALTFRHMVNPRKLTQQYPEEQTDLAPRWRGTHRMEVHADGRAKCVACGLCEDVCPEVGGNEFDVGLKTRKAIYRPFPQSVPAAYVIDREACLNDKILVCNHCVGACDPGAIDFDMQPESIPEVPEAIFANLDWIPTH